MAAITTKFAEDGTTELVFADGVVTRVPSAILYDSLGNPLITGAGDAQTPAGLLAEALLLYNGATFDRARSLAASGYGLGAALVAGTTDSVDYTASPRATTLVTAIAVTPEPGIKKRAVYIQNNTDQPIVVAIQGRMNAANIAPLTVGATFANAGRSYLISALGALSNDGGALGVSAASTGFGHIDLPFDEFRIQYSFALAPTTGAIFISYRGMT